MTQTIDDKISIPKLTEKKRFIVSFELQSEIKPSSFFHENIRSPSPLGSIEPMYITIKSS